MEKYDITDYLKDDKELQKAVIDEFLKEIAELKALKGLITVGSKQQYQCLQKIDELEQENERLKEKIESYVCSQNCYAYKQADNYRQTLQEIKEIAENFCNACKEFEPDKSKVGNCQWCNYNRVLQLITKAEEE